VRVTRFHHVSVNCHDAPLDAMTTFYGELFGLPDVPRPEIPGVPGVWKGVGDLELHLVGAPPRGTPIDSTGNHYCVAVDDLAAAIAELDAKGIEYKRAVQGDSNVQIWINDPAGNTIELQQDPASAPFAHGAGA
jgi:catechol 2,3-dioxygenase-like lactoylglutathione lyase family enzyme